MMDECLCKTKSWSNSHCRKDENLVLGSLCMHGADRGSTVRSVNQIEDSPIVRGGGKVEN